MANQNIYGDCRHRFKENYSRRNHEHIISYDMGGSLRAGSTEPERTGTNHNECIADQKKEDPYSQGKTT